MRLSHRECPLATLFHRLIGHATGTARLAPRARTVLQVAWWASESVGLFAQTPKWGYPLNKRCVDILTGIEDGEHDPQDDRSAQAA